jgi:uncharacterized membrane protein
MARFHRHGVESTAAIAGHPLHHMLVAFPIAFLIGALATDLAFAGTKNAFWAQASYWLLIAGIVTALVAAIPGFLDFFTIDKARDLGIAWGHMIGNLVVVVLAIVNVWLRWSDPATGARGWGFALSLISAALLLVNGWLGGELAYRYGLGAIPDDSPEVEAFHTPREPYAEQRAPTARHI